ncbi:MAG: trypsin-like peptidase domain-containing protein [Candidatus Riflebacteria bacterium]|nr:trypsin-like peptidase domain-containing protein [Candidatus Riflebacteria bacterium]
MSEKDVSEIKRGLWPWIIIDILLIAGVFCWLLLSEQKAKSYQGANLPGMVVPNMTNPPLRGTPVAFPITAPIQAARPVDGTTRPTPRVVSFNKTLLAISPSVVTITTEGVQSQGGSGVIVHSQGYILTNRHVVDKANQIKVTVAPDQGGKTYQAVIVQYSQDFDLALIKITPAPGDVLLPAPLGNSDKALVGDNVLVVGSPFGLSQSASSGIISYKNRSLSTGNKVFEGLIQTDAPLNLGSSGGALVNTNAEVIGINVAILSMTQSYSGIGFAIPINIAKELFDQFIEKTETRLKTKPDLSPAWGATPMGVALPNDPKSKGQVWLGVEVLNVTEALQKQLGLPFEHGVVIDSIVDKSIAENAGLVSGDIIYRVNDRLIKDDAMLWSILLELGVDFAPKEDVKFTIYRQGSKFDLFLKMKPEKGVFRPQTPLAPMVIR